MAVSPKTHTVALKMSAAKKLLLVLGPKTALFGNQNITCTECGPASVMQTYKHGR
jgi:hypothetical protein